MTAGVRVASTARPASGAAAASQVAVERELRRKVATSAARMNGRASNRIRLGIMWGSCREWAIHEQVI